MPERLASVTAHSSFFKVFGSTRLRIEPSLPASKVLTTRPWRTDQADYK